MNSYEVEVKSLLRIPERASKVRQKIKKIDPQWKLKSKNKQLNHYFKEGSLEKLYLHLKSLISRNTAKKIKDLSSQVLDFSVRTRDKDKKVFLVVKASLDNTKSSENGISRIEIEEQVPTTIDKLDERILDSGFIYQAKWSREREEYSCLGANITLDRNAGYGWVAEFEKVVDNKNKVVEAEKEIRSLMQKLEVEELSQERLKRMFDHYNKNWKKYYGSTRTFVVK